MSQKKSGDRRFKDWRAFCWSRPPAGFELRHTDDVKLFTVTGEPMSYVDQWLLIRKPAVGGELRSKEYDPGEMPALFRNFIDLQHDAPEAIGRFANRYGSLRQLESAYAGQDAGSMSHVHFEYGNFWQIAGTDLKLAVLIREALDRRDLPALQQYFQLQDTDIGQGRVRKEWWLSNRHRTAADSRPSPRGRVVQRVPTEPHEPATVDVLEVASLWLRTTIDFEVGRLCTARFVLDPVSDRQIPSIEPTSLLGALWLQFAWGYAQDKRYGQCRLCLRWFDPSPARGGRTARAVFCSDACKSQDFRKRQARARELMALGKDVDQIARQLQSEGLETGLKTIKGWLKKEPPKRSRRQ